MKKTAINLGLVAIYAVFLIWGSLSPKDSYELWFPHFDKILHMGAYATFALICAPFWWRSENSLGATFVILMLLCLFSGTMEIAQMMVPERDASWLDMVANTFGLIIGWQFSNVIKKARKMRAIVTE